MQPFSITLGDPYRILAHRLSTLTDTPLRGALTPAGCSTGYTRLLRASQPPLAHDAHPDRLPSLGCKRINRALRLRPQLHIPTWRSGNTALISRYSHSPPRNETCWFAGLCKTLRRIKPAP